MGKVRIAFLGCGNRSRGICSRLGPRPDVQVVGLCDVNEEQTKGFLAKNAANLNPAPACFTDPGEMYAKTKPDAAFIVTPHTLHFKHGMQALEAGCHVFMEKPMVTSSADAYALAAKVKESGKVFVIGYNSSCSAKINYLREAIRNKTFGKLELIGGLLSQGWMKGQIGKWRTDPRLSGGGQAYDSGAHLLNTLCWSVESNVAEVFAFVDNHGTQVDINSVFVIRFENGVMASIAIGGNCAAKGAGGPMSFMFEDARIDIDGWTGKSMKVITKEGPVQDLVIPGEDLMPDENFIESILGRAQPKTSPLNGIVQSELMDAIYESARTGKPAKPKRQG